MEPKFKVGDRVTYLSRQKVESLYNRGGYFYGGSCQGGFVGEVRTVIGFDDKNQAFKYAVRQKSGGIYTMSEKEFEEYHNFPKVKKVFNSRNIELLKKGEVTIKIPNYENYPASHEGYTNEINKILTEAGLTLFDSRCIWKYVYKEYLDDDSNKEISWSDTVEAMTNRRKRTHVNIDDFYIEFTEEQVVSVNYDIY